MNYRRTLFAVVTSIFVTGSSVWSAVMPLPEASLRLFTKDNLQESRTTSVNWLDVIPLRDQKSRAAVSQEILPGAFRVVLDPGHGGKDDGAQGLHGISEKELALKISHLVYRELEREKKIRGLNLQVTLTREADGYLSLRDRVRIANEWSADLFVSLHLNSSPVPRARGFEVYFLNSDSTDEAARRLAQKENHERMAATLKPDVISILNDVQTNQHIMESSELAETLFQSISRHVRSNGRGVRQAPFSVLSGTAMPAALIEVGYVTNDDEARLLSTFSYLKRIASSISSGIIEFALSRRKLS